MLSVGTPDRHPILTFEGQSRRDLAVDVVDPHIRLSGAQGDRQPVAAGRHGKLAVHFFARPHGLRVSPISIYPEQFALLQELTRDVSQCSVAGDRELGRAAVCADVAETLPRILLERTTQERPHGQRCRRGKRIPVRRSPQNGGEGVGGRPPLERPAAGQSLVEAASERPDVALLTDWLSSSLLGTHVRHGTENGAGLGAVALYSNFRGG